MALINALAMDAVPSPKTRPLATMTMSLLWLLQFPLSHNCSATDPITLGTVNLGLTYIPTAIPIPDGSTISKSRIAFCLHRDLCTAHNMQYSGRALLPP